MLQNRVFAIAEWRVAVWAIPQHTESDAEAGGVMHEATCGARMMHG